MNRYAIRSLKYLLYLIALFVILLVVMTSTGTAEFTLEQSILQLTHTHRGWVMMLAILILAALYPRFGFTTRELHGDLTLRRDVVLRAMSASNFTLISESEQGLTFRASTPFKRALLLWEDTITITPADQRIRIHGIRKEVVRIEFRLKSYLS